MTQKWNSFFDAIEIQKLATSSELFFQKSIYWLSYWLSLIDLTALAQALDSEQAHTSFGKLPLSVEKTQAQYSFPMANRWDGSKIFVNELTKNENIGKNAPGPQYMYNDTIKYSEVSSLT